MANLVTKLRIFAQKIKPQNKFEIRDTKKYGNGVYAKRDIKKGEVIWVLDGKEISEYICDKMIADGLLSNDNPLQIGMDNYLILDQISLSFNHSCSPNATLYGRSTLMAIKNIKKGEEITYDYSLTVPPSNYTFNTMDHCQCGSDRCRQSLGNVLTVQKSKLKHHAENGHLQDFIVEELNKINFFREIATIGLEDIYTSKEEAIIELKKRWENDGLKQKAIAFIGREFLPNYFFDKPHAISIEDVATPNLSTLSFRDAAKEMGLDPLHFEYLEDIFVTRNIDKSSLARMTFYHGLNSNNEMITTHKKVIDLSGKEEKKPFKEISTLWGENFVDFHHRLFFKHFPEAKVFDGSKWYKNKGTKAKEYYIFVFALSICHGVLFETFFDNGYEEGFTKEVAAPAFQFVTEYFGVKPLVVPIIPLKSIPGSIAEKYWWCYPEYIKISI